MSRNACDVLPFTRAVPARAARALPFVLLLGTVACLDDSPVSPTGRTVQLEIRAQVAPGPGERAVAISVYYSRQNEDRVDLPAMPARVNVPRGGTSTQAVTVQIAECLADPLRIRGESEAGCRFSIELRLLGEDGEFISEQTQEAEASAPGEQVAVEPFNLPQASVGVSSATVAFEATEHDEGNPPSTTIGVFSTTGAELGELSVEVIYPGEGEPQSWLDYSLEEDILTLRPSTTSLFPDTYTAIVRVSGSREGVASTDVAVTYTVHAAAPGGDLVIFSDVNPFDFNALENQSNVRMVHNLVSYTTTGARSSARTVQLDCGRNSGQEELLCGSFFDEFSRRLAEIDYSSVLTASKQGSLTSIPANVKVVAFLLSCEVFTASEVNVLKKFAEEGGRIVFVSENMHAFSATCGIVQDQLAADLGIDMTHVNGAIDCGEYLTIPGSSLRLHQITEGMTDIVMACSSEIELGSGAHPLYYDVTGTRVLTAVGRVDTTPIPIVTFKTEIGSRLLPTSRTIRTGLGALIGH